MASKGYTLEVWGDRGDGLVRENGLVYADRQEAMQIAANLLDAGTCARMKAVRVIGPRGKVWLQGSVAPGDGAVLHMIAVKNGERESVGFASKEAAADYWHGLRAWPARWCEIHPVKGAQ